MGEIEIDKKNYEVAYEHIRTVLYLVILLKIISTDNINFPKEQRIITEYLMLIEKKIHKIKPKRRNNESSSYTTSSDDSFLDSKNSNLLLKNNRKKIDYKILNEFEKFFLFLTSLSLYQIQLLNEKQPKNNMNRNDLPILFPKQFIDSLSYSQHRDLNEFQFLILNRYIILKDPNKPIIPSNLNFDLFLDKSTQVSQKTSRKLEKFLSIPPSIESNEHKNYLKIINSKYSKPDVKYYLKNNYNYVIKILKRLNEKEIEKLVKYPNILVDSVKSYRNSINDNKFNQSGKNYRARVMSVNDYEDITTLNKMFISKNSCVYNDKQPKNNSINFRRSNTIVNKIAGNDLKKFMECYVNTDKNDSYEEEKWLDGPDISFKYK